MLANKKNLFLLVVFLLSACQNAVSGDEELNEEKLCVSDGAFTQFNFKQYEVRVFGPNDIAKADIWEGPVCIINKKNKSSCSQDLSLIKAIKYSEESHTLLVSVFSGSTQKVIELDLDSCKT